MKPAKTKAEVRQELQTQINRFLNQGGQVTDIEPGVSGQDVHASLPVSFAPRVPRTSVIKEIQALEARKKPPEHGKKNHHKAPRKKLIKDDFGEPIRWVWDDS